MSTKAALGGRPPAPGGRGVVAKQPHHPHHAVPAPAFNAWTGAPVTLKHSGTSKHKGTRKHSAKRGWSPDEAVSCCSARAVAEAVRIVSGRLLSDDDVLGIYWSAATDADSGISILDALEASRQVFGQRCEAACARYGPGPGPALYAPAARLDAPFPVAHPVIIGLDLPYGQPHAVVAHDGAWWSWREPHDPADFPGAVIEEAWVLWR